MDGPPDLPDDVYRFLVDKIDTVPHLEALLLVWESRPDAWTAEQIAVRTYVSAEAAQGILHDLVRLKLVAAAEVPGGFRYDPGWDPGGRTMEQVVLTYRRHLVRVANLIHSKASPAVRDFARAFQFKKE